MIPNTRSEIVVERPGKKTGSNYTTGNAAGGALHIWAKKSGQPI